MFGTQVFHTRTLVSCTPHLLQFNLATPWYYAYSLIDQLTFIFLINLCFSQFLFPCLRAEKHHDSIVFEAYQTVQIEKTANHSSYQPISQLQVITHRQCWLNVFLCAHDGDSSMRIRVSRTRLRQINLFNFPKVIIMGARVIECICFRKVMVVIEHVLQLHVYR